MSPEGRTTKLERGGFSPIALIWSSVLHHLNNGPHDTRKIPKLCLIFALLARSGPDQWGHYQEGIRQC